MAVVYRAFDARLERRVALKVLSPELAADQAFRQRFIRESRAAAAVDHPNIIPIFEAGEASGVLFIAMRFVHGQDAQTLIDTESRLPAERACQILGQVASALDAAHAHGLVHRDVKPANMLLDATGGDEAADHVYLSDFGLSKQALGGTELTSTGQFLGTLNYVAPEQIEARQLDGRTDQYALACSAFAMLTGNPPFTRDQSVAIMWAQMSNPPPPVTGRRPDLPDAVNAVVAKALAKSPDERYATCREFVAALRRACGIGSSWPPGGPPEPPRHPVTRAVQPGDLAAASASAAAASVPPPSQPQAAAAAASGGPPTQAKPVPSDPGGGRPGGPYGTTPEGYYPESGRGPRKSRRRTLSVIAVAVVAVLAAGGWFLLGRGSGGTGEAAAAALKPPGCTSAVAKSGFVHPHPASNLVATGGRPFDVVANRGFAFASLGEGVAVLNTTKAVPSVMWTASVSGAQGEAITNSGRYLLVSAGAGLSVFRTADLERSPAAPIGSLSTPNARHPVQVAVSPDDRFAFVSIQNSNEIAVFNLQRALASGFSGNARVGVIPMPSDPVGLAVSPDGKYLYATSGIRTPAVESGPGTLSVIDMRKAETHPATSVLKNISAGCGPDRVLADGQRLWVTAGGSNSVLAYSAPKLLSDPKHALLARVPVGEVPLGLVLVRHGTRLVVADSNRDHRGAASNLAVIDTAKALNGKHAVLGYIRSGDTPRQFGMTQGGAGLLVADTDGGQVQSVNITRLP
jgi:serine/threonine-protein kinase